MYRKAIGACVGMVMMVAVLVAPNVARAAIIDFESLEHSDGLNGFHGTSYTEDGFMITLISGGQLTTFPTNGERFSGSTAMHNNGDGGITKLTREDGGPFDLFAIDLAELDGDFQVTVTFDGVLSGGGLVDQTFTFVFDGIPFGPQNFLFSPAFKNLAEVTWVQSFPFHQFDNINASLVPLPAALPLMGTGLALLGFMGWRRKRKTNAA